jgi:hypothetical protein
MKEPDEALLKTVLTLKTDKRFSDFIEWLRQSWDEGTHTEPAIVEDYRLRWHQGQQQTLDTILETVDAAEEKLKMLSDANLARIERSKRKMGLS